MKQKPNISIQKFKSTKLEYLSYLATENMQPNIKYPTQKSSVKTKGKPNINLQKRNIANIDAHRINVINFANKETGIRPDLLVEYSDRYKLTITSYTIATFGVESLTAKYFDIYCNGLKVDENDIIVEISTNSIILYVLKSDAVDDTFDTTNFEIVSKFDDLILLTTQGLQLYTDNNEEIHL